MPFCTFRVVSLLLSIELRFWLDVTHLHGLSFASSISFFHSIPSSFYQHRCLCSVWLWNFFSSKPNVRDSKRCFFYDILNKCPRLPLVFLRSCHVRCYFWFHSICFSVDIRVSTLTLYCLLMLQLDMLETASRHWQSICWTKRRHK